MNKENKENKESEIIEVDTPIYRNAQEEKYSKILCQCGNTLTYIFGILVQYCTTCGRLLYVVTANEDKYEEVWYTHDGIKDIEFKEKE